MDNPRNRLSFFAKITNFDQNKKCPNNKVLILVFQDQFFQDCPSWDAKPLFFKYILSPKLRLRPLNSCRNVRRSLELCIELESCLFFSMQPLERCLCKQRYNMPAFGAKCYSQEALGLSTGSKCCAFSSCNYFQTAFHYFRSQLF